MVAGAPATSPAAAAVSAQLATTGPTGAADALVVLELAELQKTLAVAHPTINIVA